MSIRIALADDHKVLRQGLSKAFSDEKDVEVVGEAENGYEIIELAKKTMPDVIIMDIAMPDMNGIEATRQIIKELPAVKIIALSMHSGKKIVHEMFNAGVKGYLLKDCELDELTNAIRIVMANKTYLSPAITEVVVGNMLNPSKEENAFAVLSDRELQVLQLLAEGKTTKQIARMLHISAKTVEGHRVRIMNKLDIDSVAKLTKYAIREGLTSTD